MPSLEENKDIEYETKIHEELPLIVYLKGDEEYFSEFSLNAEDVMGILGIKRSRLNQISGKELRVGRARIKNYIRPIYRPKDVEEYKQWIRPTATHKKSSDLLDEAREKLENESERLTEELSSRFDSIMSHFNLLWKNKFLDHRQTTRTMLLWVQKALNYGFKDLRKRSEFVKSQVLQQSVTLKEQVHSLAELREDIEKFQTAQLKSIDKIEYMDHKLSQVLDIQKKLSHQLVLLHSDLELVRKDLNSTPKLLSRERERRGLGAYALVRRKLFHPVSPVEEELKPLKEKDYIPSWRRKKESIQSRF